MLEEDLEVLDQIENEVLDDEEVEVSEENEKEAERKKKADALWKAVQMGDVKHLTTRVASILNRYPETRNSDITLQIKYWQIYNNLTSNFVDLTRLYTLERLTSISRARAKIQNEYKLFLADTEVRRRRRTLEEDEKEAQLLDKPSYGTINVFADETGKTETFVIVAGVWLLNEQLSARVQRDFLQWSSRKEAQGVKLPEEFHFKNLNNRNNKELELYKEFFNLILRNGEMISFKAVAVNKSKINRIPISDLITKLFYQFIRLGVNHEISSNRIQLPKKINLTKDEEEGESALILETVKQSLEDNFKIHYEDDLKMDQLISMPSHEHIFLQFADLFVAALNRKYNNPGNNNKDKLADYILESIRIKEVRFSASQVEIDEEKELEEIDHSILFIFD
ncbi:DUF3800 domain-containing protein [Fictibacillus sp. 5RED26]|uniref:DUF3800 domain-containing protein n=1 Tax=unclassified Fictibacillus TaxID=2644029 RepID=UPI0018CD0A9A|nr:MULTISPECIES: DUF3800 domain-containing protein [unclassified Fictibacillus]MBH0158633.1 DUF3800 domain-containing protein [Fictibacillus sp. 5RED26]MBH0175708.1 DUF3800 domain-containing protein [Fictibacillus sp. 23RED33]